MRRHGVCPDGPLPSKLIPECKVRLPRDGRPFRRKGDKGHFHQLHGHAFAHFAQGEGRDGAGAIARGRMHGPRTFRTRIHASACHGTLGLRQGPESRRPETQAARRGSGGVFAFKGKGDLRLHLRDGQRTLRRVGSRTRRGRFAGDAADGAEGRLLLSLGGRVRTGQFRRVARQDPFARRTSRGRKSPRIPTASQTRTASAAGRRARS